MELSEKLKDSLEKFLFKWESEEEILSTGLSHLPSKKNKLLSYLEVKEKLKKFIIKLDFFDFITPNKEDEKNYFSDILSRLQFISEEIDSLKNQTKISAKDEDIYQNQEDFNSNLILIQFHTTEAINSLEEKYKKVFDDTKSKEELNITIFSKNIEIKNLGKRINTLENEISSINEQSIIKGFQEEARNILVGYAVWGFLFIISLLSIGAFTLYFYLFPTTPTTIQSTLKEIIIASPLIWLGWFSGKKLSELWGIRHNYKFKIAIGKTFIAYKKSIYIEKNEPLTQKLLETTIQAFSENPIHPYQKQNSSHPIESLLKEKGLLNELINALEKIKNLTK